MPHRTDGWKLRCRPGWRGATGSPFHRIVLEHFHWAVPGPDAGGRRRAWRSGHGRRQPGPAPDGIGPGGGRLRPGGRAPDPFSARGRGCGVGVGRGRPRVRHGTGARCLSGADVHRGGRRGRRPGRAWLARRRRRRAAPRARPPRRGPALDRRRHGRGGRAPRRHLRAVPERSARPLRRPSDRLLPWGRRQPQGQDRPGADRLGRRGPAVRLRARHVRLRAGGVQPVRPVR